MNNSVKVSLGLPVYNGEEFISDAIDSVLQQTFQNFELIIADNCSTDRTQQICEQYAARDSRISYYRNEKNLGAAPNFNRTFALSSGKYFKWIAHDDVIAPDFLERCTQVLEQEPSVVLCFTDVAIINEKGQQVDGYDIDLNTSDSNPSERFRSLLLDWHLCFDVFGLIRSEILKQTPVMGNYSHGDGVLLARLGLVGKFHKICDVQSQFRRHSKQSMRLYGYSSEGGRNDYHAYTVWFDSSHKNKTVLPHWRMLWEYYNAIKDANLNWRVRLFAHIYLLRWLLRSRNVLLSDLVIAGRRMLRQSNRDKRLEVPS